METALDFKVLTITVSTTGGPISANEPCTRVILHPFQAHADSGIIYIGKSGVSTSDGYPLHGGDTLEMRYFGNLNQIHAIGSTSGLKLSCMILK